ncbi:uncharacterized protein VTP21DRAFT_3405 [Calcarisporiella thermophila]|uniref:uncharacterized protein n=1 Tax=Calcarisporiella thermophila TaxID=911321 RepID=UPI00374261E5
MKRKEKGTPENHVIWKISPPAKSLMKSTRFKASGTSGSSDLETIEEISDIAERFGRKTSLIRENNRHSDETEQPAKPCKSSKNDQQATKLSSIGINRELLLSPTGSRSGLGRRFQRAISSSSETLKRHSKSLPGTNSQPPEREKSTGQKKVLLDLIDQVQVAFRQGQETKRRKTTRAKGKGKEKNSLVDDTSIEGKEVDPANIKLLTPRKSPRSRTPSPKLHLSPVDNHIGKAQDKVTSQPHTASSSKLRNGKENVSLSIGSSPTTTALARRHIFQREPHSDDFGTDEMGSDALNELDAMMSLYDGEQIQSSSGVDGDKQGIISESLLPSNLFDFMSTDLKSLTEEARPPARRRYERFLVLEINHSAYVTEDGVQRPEKVLRMFEENESLEKYVHLREDWWHTNVFVGDYANVVGSFEQQRCIIDNENNLFILHPDCLISSTVLADSFRCQRKAVLDDRVRATGGYNEALVHGQILHQLLQSSLRENDFSSEFMLAEVERLVIRTVEALYCAGEDESSALRKLKELVPVMQEWANRFVVPRPKEDALVIEHQGFSKEKSNLCINKILDIEEHVWSPMFGLKGNIDASIQVEEQDGTRRTAPFELKTGRSSKVMSHRAQTLLYTLLMSDRYDTDITSGILYYLKTGETIRIRAVRDEIRGIIIGRNEVAQHIVNKAKLPAMIKNLHECQKCYTMDACLLFHKAIERGTAISSGLGALFDRKTAHLEERHVTFFEKWERLISLEEGELVRSRREIWNMHSSDREKLGRCWSNLYLVEQAQLSKTGVSRFSYKFRRRVPTNKEGVQLSFLNSYINVGDPIVVSSEDGHYALAIGFVTSLQPDVIELTVDRALHGPPQKMPGFEDMRNQCFTGIIDIEDRDLPKAHVQSRVSRSGNSQEDVTTYRIDKDEILSGMSTVRMNLVNLLMSDGDRRLQRLIIDRAAPRFRQVELTCAKLGEELNSDQKKAIQKVLCADDYALILGMPGTGKTTTIAHLIRTLVSNGKTILLTSYTHTAVDNVLLKLQRDGIDVVRLGNREKIHPSIRPCTPNYDGSINSVAALDAFYNSRPVVGTTCLGISHPIFTKRRFDYCIVDEASQLTLPVSVGPLRFADVFVLVGDQYQLPPLVRNLEAKEEGLTTSLFKLLSEAHPEAVVHLEHQYRMNREIMLLSNTLIYDYKLRCGTAQVAERTLSLTASNLDSRFHSETSVKCVGKCWLWKLIDPMCKVVFVDTDEIPAPDSRSGDLVQNEIEAILVHQVVEALLSCGIDQTSIGVISVYRSQLKIISHLLKARPQIEIHTVDKYQGRDKECILLSLVRSNSKQNIGDLLRDWRRINVALTRAKSKLIVFGSKTTLQSTDLFATFLTLMQTNGWIQKLPKKAHLMHSIPLVEESSLSQITTEPSPLRSRKVVTPTIETLFRRHGILKNIVDGV